ncbi:MAG: xanthine dehydrogenase FAD-binding subunit XdhB [Enterobacteriaceae bacterium]
MYDIQRYYRAENASHAVALLQADPSARLLAGGTDVLIQLRHLNPRYHSVVDIHQLADLRGITQLDNGTLRIGSATTFTELIESPLIQQRVPVLAEVAATIAGPQVRNVATLGGNICNGATSADSASPGLVLEMELEIATPQGTRFTPLLGFHTGPGKVALEQSEVVVAFHIQPHNWHKYGMAYFKYAMRDAMDIATIGCATACKIEEGRFSELKLAYGVAAPTPIRATQAEMAARGQPANQQTLQRITQAVLADVSPRTSWRAEKEFRLHLIQTLAQRVITMAIERAGGALS